MSMLELRFSSILRPLSTAAFVLVGACIVKAGPKYPDLNSFCNGRATAECSDEVLLDCAIPNKSTCITKRQQICLSTAPAGTYNPSAAENCIGQVSNAYSDGKITLDESTAIDSACLPVFDGSGGNGAACQADSDCRVSTGLRCVLSAGSSSGSCQVPQPVQGGGSCAASNAQCIAGFHCGLTAHCDIDAALGEACDSANPCGMGLLCPSAGMCVAKGADGSACTSGGDCLNGICNKSMTSATAMGLCVSQVTLASMEPFCVDSR
jgi:hypothetical protein